MASNRSGLGPTRRLDKGAAILAAANEQATQLIKARLGSFAAAQRRYAEAQRKVEEADQQLRAAQAPVAAHDADQDAALAALARALIADGQPWATPFAAFGGATLAALKRLPATDKATAIHQLVPEIKRQATISASALQCADAAEQAAQAVDAALLPLDALQQALRVTRHRRDAVGHTWDTALAALRRRSRAAADEGAPGLYTALFGRLTRPARKKASTAPAPPAPAAPAVPTA